MQVGIVQLIVGTLEEKGTLILGGFIYMLYLVIYARALSPVASDELMAAWRIYIMAAISPFGWLFVAMLPALLSKLSSEPEQGQVQGAFGACRSLAFAAGPISWGAFYGFLTDQSVKPTGFFKHLPWKVGPRDAFGAGAIIALIATLVGCTIPSNKSREEAEASASDGSVAESYKIGSGSLTQRLAEQRVADYRKLAETPARNATGRRAMLADALATAAANDATAGGFVAQNEDPANGGL